MLNSWRTRIFRWGVKLERFVIVLSMISGFKSGRLPGKLYTYKRFKPLYLSWGLQVEKVCDLRRYSVWFLRVDVVPFRVEVFITPKDIWNHWTKLRSRKVVNERV